MLPLGPVVIQGYGLVVGLAVAVCWYLLERAYGKSVPIRLFFELVLLALVSARLWHGVTDYHLYQDAPQKLLYVWQGGLSIVAAVPAVLGWIWWRSNALGLDRARLLASAVLALPAAQILGRVANGINQELYGLPSEAPWAIGIDPANRIAGFEQFDRFHPLFFYEMVLLLPLLWLSWRYCEWFLRHGYVAAGVYLSWYAGIRLGLDWLRIERSLIFWQVSINQLVFVVQLVVGIGMIGLNRKKHYAQD